MTPRDAFSPYAITIADRHFFVFANDHPPPRAHVRLQTSDRMLLVDLRTGDPMPLDWPRGALREWDDLRPQATRHFPKLLAEFERLNPTREDRQ